MKTILAISIMLLAGCTSTRLETIPRLDKPQRDLELLPVVFEVVRANDKVYYALDSANYTNLGLNMLKIQHWIYEAATWEKLNAKSEQPKWVETIKDN